MRIHMSQSNLTFILIKLTVIMNQPLYPQRNILKSIKSKQTSCPDLQFLIIFVLLSGVMFALSIVKLDSKKLFQINFPLNQQAKVCAVDFPITPYLYIISSDERVCISQCPKRSNQYIQYRCQPISQQCPTHQKIIQDQLMNKDLGGICLSESKQILLMQNTQIQRKVSSLRIIEKLKFLILPSILLTGILIPLIMKAFPKFLTYKKLILTIVLLLAFTSAFFVTIFRFTSFGATISQLIQFNSSGKLNIISGSFINEYWKQIILGTLCFLLIVFLVRIVFQLLTQNSVSLFALLIIYTNQILLPWSDVLKLMVFSILMSLLALLAIAYSLFQYWCFVSSHQLQPIDGNQIYHQITKIGFFQGITIFEAIWILHLLFQLYSFVISSYISSKYETVNSNKKVKPQSASIWKQIKQGTTFYIGSAVKSSLIKTVFIIPATIITFLKPNEGFSVQLTKGCHCLCGLLLNACQNYRITPYSMMKLYGLNYSRASLHTKYLYHIYYGTRHLSLFQFIQFYQRLLLVLTISTKAIIMCYFVLNKIIFLYVLGIVTFFYCVCIYPLNCYILVAKAMQIMYLHQNQIGNKQDLELEIANIYLINGFALNNLQSNQF